MEIKKSKNGSIQMTAKSKRDSLNLLKFMNNLIGDDDPERKKLIEEREDICNKIEASKTPSCPKCRASETYLNIKERFQCAICDFIFD